MANIPKLLPEAEFLSPFLNQANFVGRSSLHAGFFKTTLYSKFAENGEKICKVGKEGRLYKDGQERDKMIKKPFTIQFPENPVSGFSWDIATSNGLQIMRDRFIPEDEEKTGSGGYRVWDIQVTCQGSQKITGTYRRGNQIASCFEINIDAE